MQSRLTVSYRGISEKVSYKGTYVRSYTDYYVDEYESDEGNIRVRYRKKSYRIESIHYTEQGPIVSDELIRSKEQLVDVCNEIASDFVDYEEYEVSFHTKMWVADKGFPVHEAEGE